MHSTKYNKIVKGTIQVVDFDKPKLTMVSISTINQNMRLFSYIRIFIYNIHKISTTKLYIETYATGNIDRTYWLWLYRSYIEYILNAHNALGLIDSHLECLIIISNTKQKRRYYN